jgi:hypothetical protein
VVIRQAIEQIKVVPPLLEHGAKVQIIMKREGGKREKSKKEG